MENASKALIIAGAILLSILLISLGIMVYNQAKDTVGNANLDQETTQTANEKITQYAGIGVSASQANALVTAVNANNGTHPKSRINVKLSGMTVDQHYTGKITNPNATSAGSCGVNFSSGYTYDISYTIATKTTAFKTQGYVDTVTIKLHE